MIADGGDANAMSSLLGLSARVLEFLKRRCVELLEGAPSPDRE